MTDNAIEEAPRTRGAGDSRNPFVRMMTFFREVLVELRKVVTPTRRELVRYTLVVLAFVVIMMLLVTALDLVFGNLVGWVFGDLPFFGLAG